MSTYDVRVQETLFDISTQDSDRKKRLEEEYGVKMTETECICCIFRLCLVYKIESS